MLRLVGVEVRAVRAERALRVAHDYVLDAGSLAHLAYADACGACAVHDDLQLGHLLSGEFRIVHHARKRDDGRPPLIVVEHGDVERGIKPVLDLKARRCGDVLKVHSTILRSESHYRINHALGIRLAGILSVLTAVRQRHGPRIHVAERLEKNRLALHHGDGRGRAKIAQTENCGAIRNDSHEIGFCRAVIDCGRVLGYRLHGVGNARRIGKTQIILGLERSRERHADLAALMVCQNLFT